MSHNPTAKMEISLNNIGPETLQHSFLPLDSSAEGPYFLRKCRTCGNDVKEILFNINQLQCKCCVSEYSKVYRLKNKEHIAQTKKDHYIKNKIDINKKNKEWYSENRQKTNTQKKTYYKINKDQFLERAKEYVNENKQKTSDYLKQYRLTNKEKSNNRSRARMKNDLMFKIMVLLRSRIHSVFKKKYIKKSSFTQELIGADVDTVFHHIESLFTEGMTWDNIHLDHKIPCNAFNLLIPEAQLMCFNYKNLQPLFVLDNFKKHAKVSNEDLQMLHKKGLMNPKYLNKL